MIKLTTLKTNDDSLTLDKLEGDLGKERVKRFVYGKKSITGGKVSDAYILFVEYALFCKLLMRLV